MEMNFKTITLNNCNDYKVNKVFLQFILSTCKKLGVINEEKIMVFCTACFYFMTAVRSNGNNLIYYYFNPTNVVPTFPMYNNVYHERDDVKKSFLVNLSLNCINLATKVCLEKGVGITKLMNISNWPFPQIETRKKEINKIQTNLETGHVLSPYVWDFIFKNKVPIEKKIEKVIEKYLDPNFYL